MWKYMVAKAMVSFVKSYLDDLHKETLSSDTKVDNLAELYKSKFEEDSLKIRNKQRDMIKKLHDLKSTLDEGE